MLPRKWPYQGWPPQFTRPRQVVLCQFSSDKSKPKPIFIQWTVFISRDGDFGSASSHQSTLKANKDVAEHGVRVAN